MLRLILLALSVAAIAQIPAPNIVGGDVPSGASNLTTVGAIPYVSAAGILNQDPTALFWDAANDRLGVGTNAPGVQLHVRGGASGAAVPLVSVTPSRIVVENSAESSISILSPSASGSFLNFGSQLDGRASGIGRVPNSSSLFFYVHDLTERMRIAPTGNLLIGTTTDGNFRLDVATSGSAGTARFYGGSGVSDSTKVVVQAGAGQSGALQEWQNSGGAIFSLVSNVDGRFAASTNGVGVRPGNANALYISQASASVSDAMSVFYYTGGSKLFGLSSNVNLTWSSSAADPLSSDLSLSRASAGVLRVGDGGSNANGEIQAKIHTWINGTEATCNSTTRGEVVMVQGGAGVADTLRVCRKDAADAYAWTALY